MTTVYEKRKRKAEELAVNIERFENEFKTLLIRYGIEVEYAEFKINGKIYSM